MTPETIAATLGPYTTTGGKITATCPAHDDNHPSLAIDEKNGKLLFKCRAGCPQAAVMSALKASGIRDIFGNDYRMPPLKQRITGTFIYHDEHGGEVYRKERLEPGRHGKSKEFRFKSAAGYTRGGDPVLYRLPEILAADTVFIAEGEKCADKLASWELAATTLDSGADSKLTAQMVDQLADRHIIILPDNDDPGRAYAQRLVAGLTLKAASVKVVTLPGLPVKGDVIDWTGTREDLERLVAAAATPDDGTGKAARFTLLSSSDLRDRPALEWTIKGLLPSRGIGQCFGPSMSGKSFLSFAMGVSAAGDSADWFGHRISRHRPVVYVALEGQHGVRQRAEAWEQYHGRPLPDDFHIVLDPLKITDQTQVEELAAVCPKGCLLIIDTQNCAAPGADENSSKDMGLIIEGSKQLERLIEGFVLLVAHTGKDASKGPRGHSSQIPAADLVIEVTRDGDRREWIARKVKDGADGARHPFALKVIELGFDDDDDEITSCVIDPDVALSAPKKLMTESQRQGMASFRIAAETDGLLDDDGNFAGLHLEAWRVKFYELSTADSPAAKQKAFARVRKDLVTMEKLSVKSDVYRLAGPTAEFDESEFARCLAGHGH